MTYVDEVLALVKNRDPNEPEFHQAVKECLESIRPLVEENEAVYRENSILERFVEPDRIISFCVPWVDRDGKVQVNRGWRIQYSNAIGAYKGGLRFHKSVNQSILKFLGFEMVLKNSLTGLPMGGAKGGSDFDPKGKTDREIMSFCQSFASELYKYIGFNTDCPAGDIGCGAREIGYMFGQFKRLSGSFEGSFSGKGLTFGGSLGRKEATGYGLVYMVEEMCKAHGKKFEGNTVIVTGSGNVAMYTVEKCQKENAKVIAMSDSDGYIYDPNGIDLSVVKQIKEVERGRIKEYADRVPGSAYTAGHGIWNLRCDIYLPCATQNEISLEAAKTLVNNGTFLVAEGANMPATPEATKYFQENGVLFMPGKASNAGGVSVSGLEQAQNAARYYWSFEKVDKELKQIMQGIFNKVDEAAKRYGMDGDYVAGANIYAFERVASAMISQGIV